MNIGDIPESAADGKPLDRCAPTADVAGGAWPLDVLVVDDDPADTALILAALHCNPDVTSVRAVDAPEVALRQLAVRSRRRPDLVLLDIQMAKMNGFGFLASMRKLPAMRSVPVVFLTTSDLASDVVKSHESSAALYVRKPNSNAELRSRLDGVIRLTKAGRLVN
jgi:CheY-like chemotaxis protein